MTDLIAQAEAALDGVTDLIARLGRWKLAWGDLPSIAPHVADAPGMTTGGVIADTHEAAAALTALIARVRELEGERGKCPLGDDCDLTVAWMAGQQEARLSFAARLDEARAREGLARVDADNQRQKAEAAEAKLAEVEKERERLGREVNMARYGQPDFAWSIHKQAMAEMTARAETAEATVATLTAQVEAMRDGADMAKRRLEAIADEAWNGDARDFKRRIPGVFAEFAAALTTEKKDD
jgi:cell division protein FtsB